MVWPVSSCQTRSRSGKRANGSERLRAEFVVPLPAGEIVDDGDTDGPVSISKERWPNHNSHRLPELRSSFRFMLS